MTKKDTSTQKRDTGDTHEFEKIGDKTVELEHVKIQAMIEGLTNGVALFDKEKKVILTNPAMMRMTGLPQKGFYLSELSRLFGKDQLNIEEKLDETLTTGNVVHIEEVSLSKFFYEIIITPVFSDHTKEVSGGAIVLHDITHLKEIDQMKTDFIYFVSHQLRTPITIIAGNIEIVLNNRATLSDEQLQSLDDAQSAAERMAKLTSNLLNISRLESGELKIEPTLMYIEDILLKIIKDNKLLATDHQCTIVLNTSKKKLKKILIDSSLLWEVVSNLIVNAIQYSRKKGVISLSVEERSGEYVISVTDSGIGIPENMRLKIFGKFFRADNARTVRPGGSGIGLYLIKMIVEAFGGKIWFTSKEGVGTTFNFTIPTTGMNVQKGKKVLI